MSPPKCHFFITGFGPFNGVQVNPTNQMVNHFSEASFPTDIQDHVSLLKVVETSMQGAQDAVEEIKRKVEALDESAVCVFLHLGVNVGSSEFNFECRAFNEATFRCPDERGNVCVGEKVIADDTADERFTRLNLRGLTSDLAGKGMGKAKVTNDPGRFICNYIFFTSLSKLSSVHPNRCASMFMHVPAFHTIPQQEQQQMLVEFLRCCIARCNANSLFLADPNPGDQSVPADEVPLDASGEKEDVQAEQVKFEAVTGAEVDHEVVKTSAKIDATKKRSGEPVVSPSCCGCVLQ